MRWLADGSAASVAAAVREVAPWLAGESVHVREVPGRDEPLWQASSARIGDGHVAKFAWSQPAARRVAHEIGVVTALRDIGDVPNVAEVVASGLEPVLLITRRVPGRSLFEAVDTIDRERAGRDLGRFLAALHRTSTMAAVEAAIGELPEAGVGTQHPVGTAELRQGLGHHLTPYHWTLVVDWCDWADATLAQRLPAVLVHADLHGDNQIWDGDQLRLVVDFETASAGEPEYDLRVLPGIGPGGELLRATMAHYVSFGGRRLDLDRILAWHLLTVLSDALWRSDAGIPMPDGRTAAQWVDDLSLRLAAAGAADLP